MVKLEEFVGDIALSTSVNVQPLIEKAIVQTAIDFCEETKIYKAFIDPIVLAANTSEYNLCTDTLIKIVQVEEVYFNGARIGPIAIIDMPYNWQDRTGKEPIGYYLDSRDQIKLYPAMDENAAGEITVYASLKPHRKSTSLPDILADDWYDAILFGAKARLHTMKRMEFFDPSMARECRTEYKNEKTRAKNLVARSFVNKDLKSRIRPAA